MGFQVGYRVSAVRPESEASKSGIKTGDTIIRLNKIWFRLTGINDGLFDLVAKYRGGDTINLDVFTHDGKTSELKLTLPLPACEEERWRQVREEQKRQAEARQRQAEESRSREIREAAEAAAKASERRARRDALFKKYNAEDFSDYKDALKFWLNPFAYQGKHIFLSGGYHKNIGPREAIVAIVPARNPTEHIVQWDTSRNLAQQATSGSPFVRCVVKVLGTIRIQQGLVEREIPHVKEVECLK